MIQKFTFSEWLKLINGKGITKFNLHFKINRIDLDNVYFRAELITLLN